MIICAGLSGMHSSLLAICHLLFSTPSCALGGDLFKSAVLSGDESPLVAQG